MPNVATDSRGFSKDRTPSRNSEHESSPLPATAKTVPEDCACSTCRRERRRAGSGRYETDIYVDICVLLVIGLVLLQVIP